MFSGKSNFLLTGTNLKSDCAFLFHLYYREIIIPEHNAKFIFHDPNDKTI